MLRVGATGKEQTDENFERTYTEHYDQEAEIT